MIEFYEAPETEVKSKPKMFDSMRKSPSKSLKQQQAFQYKVQAKTSKKVAKISSVSNPRLTVQAIMPPKIAESRTVTRPATVLSGNTTNLPHILNLQVSPGSLKPMSSSYGQQTLKSQQHNPVVLT